MLQRAVGPSGATRTRGFLLPKQAPYQLGYTRIYLRYVVTLPIIKHRKSNCKGERELTLENFRVTLYLICIRTQLLEEATI